MSFPTPTGRPGTLSTSDGQPLTDLAVLDMLGDLVDADAAGTHTYATYHQEAVRRGLIEGVDL